MGIRQMKIVISSCYGGFGVSDDALAWMKSRGVERFDYHDRTNPVFVECVETLGKLSSDQCSCLTVIEIPDDVDWQIEDYDGSEWVAEKHRTWCA